VDGVQRWGTNIVTSVGPTQVGNLTATTLTFNFDANPADRPAGAADASGYSGPNEAILSDHDSGGAVFIQSGAQWKLAGINWSVATGFAYTANSPQIGSGQALFDCGGFYLANSNNRFLDAFQDKPAFSVATAISPHIAEIAATLAGGPPVWNVDAGGNWSTAGNWWTNYYGSAPLPNAVGAQAIFGRVITAPRTVTLTSDKTVGALTFDSPQAYTLAGTGRLVLDSTAPGGATINVTAGAHTVSAPLKLNVNTTLTVTPDAGNTSKLTITGNLSASAGVTLTKAGAGPMEVAALRVPGVSVMGGVLRVLPNGTTAATGAINSLSIAAGATLDLANNSLVIDYSGASPADMVRQYLLSGRSAGSWTGSTGIISSAAAADAQQRTAIGLVEASALLGLSGAATATWSGQTVDATSLLLKYTWYGDANLDGKVDADDYALIDRGMAAGLTGWLNGDFNYDGVVNTADYVLIDRAYALQSGTLAPEFLAWREAQFGTDYVAGLLASVPEPSSAACALAGIALLRRRRWQRL
jgi:hypothetical protein